MHDLAARCEAADESSRELDAEIAIQVLGWKLWRSKHGYWNLDGPNGERASSFEGPRQLRFDPDTGEANPHYDTPPLTWLADEAQLPAFTASVDVAMTLIQDGHWWSVAHNAGPQPLTCDLFRSSVYLKNHQGPPPFVRAATPALALCAASLRARAT